MRPDLSPLSPAPAGCGPKTVIASIVSVRSVNHLSIKDLGFGGWASDIPSPRIHQLTRTARICELTLPLTRARRGREGADVLGFISIFAASVAGFANVGLWAIAACAIALASTSYAEHHDLYRRGQELGLTDTLRGTVLRSFGNGLIASGGAYAAGYLLRVI